MNVFLLGITIAIAHSLKTIPEFDQYPSPEFYRLTKLMNRSDYGRFNTEFRNFLARYNFSESSYSDNCFNAYVDLRITTWEKHGLFRDFRHLVNGMKKKPITHRLVDNWREDTPHTHLMITSRRKAIEKLSAKSQPETREFVKEVVNLFMELIIESFAQTGETFEKLTRTAIVNIAMKYQALSKNVKRDLEHSLCVRNTLQWINADMSGIFDEYFELFSESLELNIDNLLKGNAYLSSFPIDQVKEKFKRRAAKHNVPAQEYVDTCAEVFTAMKLTENEMAVLNLTTEEFMGKDWGTKEYNYDEWDLFITDLYNENPPFINIVSKRWNFAKLRLMNNHFQSHLSAMGRQFAIRLFEEHDVQERRQVTPHTNFFVDIYLRFLRYEYVQELEQVLCIQSTVESILEREIDK